jgi:hypothetical protein
MIVLNEFQSIFYRRTHLHLYLQLSVQLMSSPLMSTPKSNLVLLLRPWSMEISSTLKEPHFKFVAQSLTVAPKIFLSASTYISGNARTRPSNRSFSSSNAPRFRRRDIGDFEPWMIFCERRAATSSRTALNACLSGEGE